MKTRPLIDAKGAVNGAIAGFFIFRINEFHKEYLRTNSDRKPRGRLGPWVQPKTDVPAVLAKEIIR